MFGNNGSSNGVSLNQSLGLVSNLVGVPSIDTPPSPPPMGTASPTPAPSVMPAVSPGINNLGGTAVAPQTTPFSQQDETPSLEFRKGPFDPKLPGEEDKPFTEGILEQPTMNVDAAIAQTPAKNADVDKVAKPSSAATFQDSTTIQDLTPSDMLKESIGVSESVMQKIKTQPSEPAITEPAMNKTSVAQPIITETPVVDTAFTKPAITGISSSQSIDESLPVKDESSEKLNEVLVKFGEVLNKQTEILEEIKNKMQTATVAGVPAQAETTQEKVATKPKEKSEDKMEDDDPLAGYKI